MLLHILAVVHQGYGEDSDRTLDAFPFTQATEGKDDDAVLRQQIKGMGKGQARYNLLSVIRNATPVWVVAFIFSYERVLL